MIINWSSLIIKIKGNYKNKLFSIALKEELKIEITKIWRILLAAKESFNYSYYLHFPDSEMEKKYLKLSSHFQFIRISLWKLTIIELAKLFNDRSNHDIYKIKTFLNKLKPEGCFGNLKFDQKKITNWENFLKTNKPIIREITDLRNKAYSHTDENSESFIYSDLTFEKLEKLIKFCEDIIVTIYDDVFESHALIDSVYFDHSFKSIIEILSKENIERINEI